MKNSITNKFWLIAIVAASTLAVTARAQIGTGWQTDVSTGSLQKVGNVYYSKSSGVETFRLNDADASRCEIRINNDYSSGSHQFEGYVKCSGSARSSGHAVQQILANHGDAHQTRIYNANGGSLRSLPTGTYVATGVYGVYVRVNCINYRSTGKVELWINGSKKTTANDAGSVTTGEYYFKYGIYIAGSSGKPQTQWKSIRVWKK